VSSLLFVYGTLKRGCSNHGQLAGETFVGTARTQPGFRLYDVGGYPGLVLQAEDVAGVSGEVWAVSDESLRRLDAFEGVHEGLYRRAPVALLAPFSEQRVDAYFFASSVSGRREIGAEWIE
jgi:gamma-glutamylcyclotransferase (GGCT)/AIG2-like uncharacterized protein YtfP